MRALCRRRVIGVRLQDSLKMVSGFAGGVSSEGVKSQIEMRRPTPGIALQNGAITSDLIDKHTRVCRAERGQGEQECERANVTRGSLPMGHSSEKNGIPCRNGRDNPD